MWKKLVRTALVGAALSMLTAFTALANDIYKDVKIRVNEDKAEAGVIYPVEFEVRGCEIENISMSTDQSEWKAGKKVTITLDILPSDGYSFSSSSTKVSVTNGEMVSSNIKAHKIVAKINYIPSVQLTEPINIYWGDDDKSMIAYWDEVEYATGYEVRVLIDGKKKDTIKVTKNQVDLRKYATDGDEVTFEVRACGKNDKDAKYLKASNWVDCDEVIVADDDNTSKGNFKGNYDNYTFKDQENNNVSGWQYINGIWFYFDPDNGNKAVCENWKFINNKWYYFNTYCQMQTGWLHLGDNWYYLNHDGDMATGWVCLGPSGPWYYMDTESGAMWHDATTPDGYYVGSDGAWFG